MRSLLWWCGAALALCLLVSPTRSQVDDKSEPPANRSAVDAVVVGTLRDVINRGADLYNSGDIAGCYRLFEGSLRTIKPLLEHHPELQKEIDSALVNAERDPYVWRRAFTLRRALDKIRAELKPKKAGEKKEPLEKKEPEKEPPVKKEPEKKEPPKKEPPEKDTPEVLEKKPAEIKDTSEKKEPDEKKESPEKKEPDEKNPDAKKSSPEVLEKNPVPDKTPADKMDPDDFYNGWVGRRRGSLATPFPSAPTKPDVTLSMSSGFPVTPFLGRCVCRSVLRERPRDIFCPEPGSSSACQP